jgi:hypothetical protein
MKNILNNRVIQFSLLAIAAALMVVVLKSLINASGPDRSKVGKLSDELHAGCQANDIKPVVALMHNGSLLETHSPVEFVQKYSKESTSIPYDKKERGRMYPVAEFFDLKQDIQYVQLITCARSREIILSRSDVLAMPDPVYWMSKRKGFLSVHSMIYDKSSDTSKKTSFKARPILVINLIDEPKPDR